MASCPKYVSRLHASEGIFLADVYSEPPPTGMANPRTPQVPKHFTTETKSLFGFSYDVPKYRVFPIKTKLEFEDLIE